MDEPSEELRLKLVAEELELRKKQPTAWTKTKFRKTKGYYDSLERMRLERYAKEMKSRSGES